MEIEIKDRYAGEVLFSHECENNTVKITLIKAIEENADLWSADLRDANLKNANLWNADNIEEAKGIPMYCKWSHGITNNNLIHIGCEKRTIEEWDDFFESTEVLTTDRDTPEFRQIQAVCEGYKAYLTFLGGNQM